MHGDAVDQVRERTDIVEVIGQHVTLRKAGRNFKGLCPFHQEKTPSFIVFPETQTFHCFGCGVGGDVFNFVMQFERVDFREALQTLAQRAGVTLEQAAPPPPEVVERHARLYELNARAASFYAWVLWNSPHGAPGRELLEHRGVDRATAERFQLGFAPDRWDALLTWMLKRGATQEEVVAAGLATQRDDGGAYDRFRNRLMFPIRDREGRVVGFGGRALGDAQPKYLNTAQTAIFDKGKILYALDLAQDAIRRTHEVVVVEGYMDAIAAHQHGFENVVASMGTALTEEQVKQIRRGVDRIILALDADAAGQMATLRGLDVLRESLGEADRPVLDARGLVRFERTLKADIRIAPLPEGQDPDDLIRRDPDAWRAAVAEAKPLLDFYIDAVIGDTPPTDPREKSELVDRIGPVVREIGDEVVRAHYVAEVSRRLGLPEHVILRARPATSRRIRREDAYRPRRPIASPEEHLLALVVTYPEIVAPLIPQVPEEDLLDTRHRALLRLLTGVTPEQAAAVVADPPEELREHVEALRELMAERPPVYPGQIRIEFDEVIRRLRRERFDFRMAQLQAEIHEAERAGDREALRHIIGLIETLKSRFPEFYPDRSPYFRDVRDTG
ncbi:DNA primase [Sphaerobacter thermophilus]|uniref:DNA primase n=1 Tax=Sphaerobacter thermophilus TaxID=2057 RepID=UPI0039C424B7